MTTFFDNRWTKLLFSKTDEEKIVMSLTERQKKIINFIENWFSEYEYAPSVRDIQLGCQISSTSVVQYNLDKLKSLGMIKSDSEVSRSLTLLSNRNINKYNYLPTDNETVAVPMLGTIAAGSPFPLPEEDSWSDIAGKDFIDLPQSIVGRGDDIYALKIKGESMIDALISDGDTLIMQHTKTVLNGQMAAVKIKSENTTTLKHYYNQGKLTRLEPANSQIPPILLDSNDVEIIGRVMAIWRLLP